MKKAILSFVLIFIVIVAVLLALATIKPKNNNKNENSYVLPQLEKTYVISENYNSKISELKDQTGKKYAGKITINAFGSGFSPDTIYLEKGKKYLLVVVNNNCKSTRFMINGMEIDEHYTKGGIIYIELRPSEKGTFYFGDDTKSSRHGTIIVR